MKTRWFGLMLWLAVPASSACTNLADLPERDDWVLGEDEIILITTGCFDQQLPWDPHAQVSECHFLLGFRDMETCPSGVDSTEPYHSEDGTMLYCTVPKVPTPLDCGDYDWESHDDDFGWYYCENFSENFDYNCSDGVDNDSDGHTDCDDDECAGCPSCGGNGAGCYSSCKWVVQGTQELMVYVDDIDADQMGVYCPGGTGSD